MSKHKHQHYIPSSYLEAWCDKNSPPGQIPYIWLISKDGSEISAVQNKIPLQLEGLKTPEKQGNFMANVKKMGFSVEGS